MLDINFIKENKELVINRLAIKNFHAASEAIEEVIKIDASRRIAQKDHDEVLTQSNQMAKSIGMLMKDGKKDEAEDAKKTAASLRDKAKELGEIQKKAETDLREALLHIPNIPHSSVPAGNSDEDNVVISEKGTIPTLYDGAKPHWDLIEQYDIIDFELGNKITGAGFPVYKGKGAQLQRGLVNFFLNEAIKAGYEEVQPPILINEESGIGTGNLPDKDGQMYHMERDGLFLIPTAEIPVTNMYRGDIIDENELPKKNTAFTPCFRREAGSWGADVRGLNRLHQFDKVEIVQIAHPNKSYEVLDEMCAHVESLLEKLELPYRKLRLCGGDLSVTSALTYDYEVYSAGQGRWLEVSSVSNFETYQSNRLKLRYKDADKKKHLLHTLNGSALALPRILATLLENNQTAEGIKIPEVLVPIIGFDTIS